MGQCDDRECQKIVNELHQEIYGVECKGGLKQVIMKIDGNQERRKTLINSKIPKKWLFAMMLVLAPVTGTSIMILNSLATAETRFAPRDIVIIHDQKICTLEKNVEDLIEEIAEQRKVDKNERDIQTAVILDAIERIKP